MLATGTRIKYQTHEDFDRAQGLCIVVDTSSLVTSPSALTLLERIQADASHQKPKPSGKVGTGKKAPPSTVQHLVVVPSIVVKELEYLTQNGSSLPGDRARRLLDLFVKSPVWTNRPSAKKMFGITKQAKNESSASLDQFVRVNDTSIVSCAVHFHNITRHLAERVEYSDDEEGRHGGVPTGKDKREQEEMLVGKRLTVLLTEDTVMRVKASTYDIPVFSLSELSACYM